MKKKKSNVWNQNKTNKKPASFWDTTECKSLYAMWFVDGKEAELSTFTVHLGPEFSTLSIIK